jgi:hypothetical protein
LTTADIYNLSKSIINNFIQLQKMVRWPRGMPDLLFMLVKGRSSPEGMGANPNLHIVRKPKKLE